MVTPGINDDLFTRGDVPMTKEEIRILSLCKLHLEPDSVLFDIGSGTGSISIEAARLSQSLQVFAIESNPAAVDLTAINAKNFGVEDRIQIVHALAPDGLSSLPAPTHAFIGGSRGNLKDILTTLYAMNSTLRVVITAVSLETISEMSSLLRTLKVANVETMQVQVSKTRQLGSYNLLTAANPVFIFAFDFVQD